MTPMAHVHISSAEIPLDVAFAHINGTEAMANVTIDPGRSELVKVTIRVSREDFVEFTAKYARVALDPPTAGTKTVERAALRIVDGMWQAENVVIPQRGIWTVRVTITPKRGEPILLGAPILIER